MLILTRKVGESIIIGDDIVVTVSRIRDGQTRIGIDAPLSTAVHRMEIHQKNQAQKLETAND